MEKLSKAIVFSIHFQEIESALAKNIETYLAEAFTFSSKQKEQSN